MKILHTADWHLGKKLDQYSRLEEQREVMLEICEIADQQNVDVVIIAGDLYDTFNPAAEAQDLFFKTVHRLSNNGKRAVIAIAGNHDMPERIEAPHPLAEANAIILCGFPDTLIQPFTTEAGVKIIQSEPGFIEIQTQNSLSTLRLLFTPYANELRLKTYLGDDQSEENLRNLLQKRWSTLADKYCDEKGVNLLMAHLYFMKKEGVIEEEPEGEKSILHIGGAQAIYSENIPPQIQYVALGHLHRYHSIDEKPCPIIYSSSPLCYSFAEADQIKKVVIIDAELGEKVNFYAIDLKKGRPLTRKEFGSVEEAVTWLVANQETYIEITIRTDTYLDGTARKQLADAHSFIVDVIPKIIKSEGETNIVDPFQIDDSRDLNALFLEYFKYKNGPEEPSENIKSLFREVISQNTEL